METPYAELVKGYLKSEKDAQPFYDRLRAIKAKREAFNAEAARCKTAHPGRTRQGIAAYMGPEV